ncbi:MAG TPA: hypothetical protein VM580_01750 [Labilithrix sp.]|jgi:hypothetical protein|nr:hypothetical protein [Labilithrix sp.]
MSVTRLVFVAIIFVAGCNVGVRDSFVTATTTPNFPEPWGASRSVAARPAATPPSQAPASGAATPPPGGVPPVSPAGRRGTVIRSDGTKVSGRILDSKPGRYVTITLDEDGRTTTLAWDRVDEVIYEGPSPAR